MVAIGQGSQAAVDRSASSRSGSNHAHRPAVLAGPGGRRRRAWPPATSSRSRCDDAEAHRASSTASPAWRPQASEPGAARGRLEQRERAAHGRHARLRRGELARDLATASFVTERDDESYAQGRGPRLADRRSTCSARTSTPSASACAPARCCSRSSACSQRRARPASRTDSAALIPLSTLQRFVHAAASTSRRSSVTVADSEQMDAVESRDHRPAARSGTASPTRRSPTSASRTWPTCSRR